MVEPAAKPGVVRFGLFELDLDSRELRKSGVRIKLQDQPFVILALLLEHPGAIVTREEIQRKLWPEDTFVDFDLSLNSAVKKLRQALNDDSENPRFIETLYRRGYRFIGPVIAAATSPQISPVAAAQVPPAEAQSAYPVNQSTSRSKRWLIYAGVVLFLGLTGIATFQLMPPHQPSVLGYTQITHDGLAKHEVVTDGQRLYFTSTADDHFVVRQVSVAGGESSVVPAPFENTFLEGISPNGSSLLVGSFHGTGVGHEVWSVPVPSGAPRRLGDFTANSGAYSPDGSHLFFSKGGEIHEANSDGSEPRKLATVGTQVFGIHPSPDGSLLRFEVADSRNGSSSIWEMHRDGTRLHPLLPSWQSEPRQCCGNWTPDGKYFLFESFREGRDSVWALPEKSSWFNREPKPIQLTNGPLNFGFPVASKDGKRIFVVGAQPRCELMRYDGKSGFTPFLNGISVSDVSFSSDGKWIAYISIPEQQLWRSKLDGSERLQLTFDPMEAALPRWSPNGKQLVLMGATPKTGWRAYVVSTDGSGLREVDPGADAGFDPGWSPDGKSIVLTLNEAGSTGILVSGPGIVTVDVDTGKVTPLPGAKQVFSPRWSPDGKYIAAVSDDSEKLLLFDRATQQWQDLVSMPIGYPTWSHDGQYIYFDTTFTEDANFFRLRVSDHKVERVVSLNGLHRYWGNLGPWTGLAPDDSPLITRDTSSQEIYAIEWQP